MVGQKISRVNQKGGEILKKSSDKSKIATKSSTTAALARIRSGFITKISKRKRKYVDKSIQTVNVDIELVTGTGEPPLKYWKDLAETRRLALEETLEENESLHKRVEELQQDNQELEEMLVDAKNLAESYCLLSDLS